VALEWQHTVPRGDGLTGGRGLSSRRCQTTAGRFLLALAKREAVAAGRATTRPTLHDRCPSLSRFGGVRHREAAKFIDPSGLLSDLFSRARCWLGLSVGTSPHCSHAGRLTTRFAVSMGRCSRARRPTGRPPSWGGLVYRLPSASGAADSDTRHRKVVARVWANSQVAVPDARPRDGHRAAQRPSCSSSGGEGPARPPARAQAPLDNVAMEISAETFSGPDATREELQRARDLLARDGLVPITDAAGHRGALQLWRQHCQMTCLSRPAMVAALQDLLNRPRPAFERVFDGRTVIEQLAWVRPSDIAITTHPTFPYHHSVAGLAELAINLLAEKADPEAMAMILGNDYGVVTVAAPHGLLHQVSHNGNHRTAAIRAAGFPVALVHTVRYDGPWDLPFWRPTRAAYLRLLSRAGILSNQRAGEFASVVDAANWGHLLLADSVGAALADVVAYEGLCGRCDVWPDWLRDPRMLVDLLNYGC